MKNRWKFGIAGAASALALAVSASPLGFNAMADHTEPTWVSSDQWGNTDFGEFTMYNNIWGSGAGSQTISVVDPSHWWVDADHPDTGGIKSYPNASFTLGQQVSQMPQVSSTATWEGPSEQNGVAYNAAWDVWGNGHDHEIMIWLAGVGPVGPLGSYETTVTIGGHSFDYYRGNNGANEVYTFIRTSNTNSATVDITGHAKWLVDTGRMPDVRIDQIQFGYEITSSAGGHRFSTEHYSLDIDGSGGGSPGTGEIVARHSGKCLDVASASTADGADVQQYDCWGGDNQQWQLESVGGGYYQIVAQHSGKCMDVEGASTANGAQVLQWSCNGGDNQQWELRDVGGAYVEIVARHSGKCLDVASASTANGADVQQYDCWGGDNQQFSV